MVFLVTTIGSVDLDWFVTHPSMGRLTKSQVLREYVTRYFDYVLMVLVDVDSTISIVCHVPLPFVCKLFRTKHFIESAIPRQS